MGFRIWYLKHFDKDKLLEELSKPVEGEFVAVKEGNMVTRVRKEDLEEYMRFSRDMKSFSDRGQFSREE
ncbi:hypothetical protein M1583_02150 [Candidatus Marsarchaeota archaeon]|nr:hypothetical protein [Candidatus Marsarchaeota archaeon]